MAVPGLCAVRIFLLPILCDEPINWQALFDFLPVTTTDGKQARGDEMILLPYSRVLCQHQVLPFALSHRPSFPGQEAGERCRGGWFLWILMACCVPVGPRLDFEHFFSHEKVVGSV